MHTGCEYMTAGTVVILGETGRNLAAGMSGGDLFVHDPGAAVAARLNHELVEAVEFDAASTELLHGLLERHLRYTDSARAAELLARWPLSAAEFRGLAPTTRVAADEEPELSSAAG